jgi:hypothetical protein
MRSLVVLANGTSPAPNLGWRKSLEERLAHLNTGPDRLGGDVLFGPGVELQLPPQQDPVMQMILTVSDEDIGWLVVERMGKTLQWKFVDLNTGDELSFSSR